MVDNIVVGGPRAQRPIIHTVALWLALGFSGSVSATTLLDMFDGTKPAFTRDGLEFSNFAPVLTNTFPAGQDLELLLKSNPLALFNVQFLDFTTAAKFSHGWGNATAANAGNIGLVELPDNPATVGVDPGFRLNSGAEWTVDAGISPPTTPIASGQLSAFAYDVKTLTSQKINSAEITQFSTIDAVGPDVLSFLPPSLPDVALGFALQFIMDLNTNDILKAILNVTVDLGVQSPNGVMQFSQFDGWSGFAGRDAIRVVNVVGVAASSGGGFTMDALEQRIDPPQPTAQIPQPGTLLLISIGLLGMAYWRRRTTDQ